MGPVLSLILIGACIVITVGAVAVWMAIKRPVQSRERRQRDDALAAAERYTPATRQPVYGAPARPDPCAPGLSDQERVAAMRALLHRGDAHAAGAEAESVDGFAATRPSLDDEVMTTSPMAWRQTQPVNETVVGAASATQPSRATERREDMVPLT
jgi:cell division septation protein DedD